MSHEQIRRRSAPVAAGRALPGPRHSRWLWSMRLPVVMVLLTLLLSGCGALRPRPSAAEVAEVVEVSAAAREAEVARQAWLAAHRHWSLAGRAAVSKGRNGGSGRVDWQQQDAHYRIQLSAPVSRQSWVLDGDSVAGTGRLQGLEGGPREADDAEQMLLAATGWQIPVNQLSGWLRGEVSDAVSVDLDAEGRPLRLRQQGWEVDFQQWYPAQEGRPALPRRIEARNGDAKVRLLVDQWDVDGS
jgi:outer membrane lipoprotein LolB